MSCDTGEPQIEQVCWLLSVIIIYKGLAGVQFLEFMDST